MKKIVLCLCLFALMVACVQKTHKKTVVYILHLTNTNPAVQVGVRGKDKPLSWESDTIAKLHVPDSTYRVAITYQTGYKFTEVKFVVNSVFELADQPNRRIIFSDSDTTFYEATVNKPGQLKKAISLNAD